MPRRMFALHNTTTKDTTKGKGLMLCVIRTAGANFHLYKKQLRVSVLTVNTLQKKHSAIQFIVESDNVEFRAVFALSGQCNEVDIFSPSVAQLRQDVNKEKNLEADILSSILSKTRVEIRYRVQTNFISGSEF